MATGVAVVLAWLLRLCHALQAGKPLEVDTLSIVIRTSGGYSYSSHTLCLQGMRARAT